MSSLTSYNQLQVLTPNPSGTGGLAINNNFKMLSTKMAGADPGPTNDSASNYAKGSIWYNTTTKTTFICVDATTGAAKWNTLPTAIGFTNQATSGTITALAILPVYNQTSGTAANTDLLINRTETLVGSGDQFLIDAQVGGTSMFNVDNVGNQFINGDVNMSGGNIAGVGMLSTNGANNLVITDTGINRAGTSTSLPLIISPKGTGAIQVDSGGNARGTYALDFQSQRIAATQVASGSHSFVRGENCTAAVTFSTASGIAATASGHWSTASGVYCTSSGYGSLVSRVDSVASGDWSTASGAFSTSSGASATASGYQSTASGDYSTSSGYWCKASKRAQLARNSYSFSGTPGDNQQTLTHLGASTTNVTQTELTTTGAAPSGTTEPGSNRFLVTASKSYGCLITVLARKSDGTTAYFVRQVIATNVSGTVSIGTVTTVGADTNPNSWGLTIQADNTNKSLQVLVTGAASTNIRWRATVRADEIIY